MLPAALCILLVGVALVGVPPTQRAAQAVRVVPSENPLLTQTLRWRGEASDSELTFTITPPLSTVSSEQVVVDFHYVFRGRGFSFICDDSAGVDPTGAWPLCASELVQERDITFGDGWVGIIGTSIDATEYRDVTRDSESVLPWMHRVSPTSTSGRWVRTITSPGDRLPAPPGSLIPSWYWAYYHFEEVFDGKLVFNQETMANAYGHAIARQPGNWGAYAPLPQFFGIVPPQIYSTVFDPRGKTMQDRTGLEPREKQVTFTDGHLAFVAWLECANKGRTFSPIDHPAKSLELCRDLVRGTNNADITANFGGVEFSDPRMARIYDYIFRYCENRGPKCGGEDPFPLVLGAGVLFAGGIWATNGALLGWTSKALLAAEIASTLRSDASIGCKVARIGSTLAAAKAFDVVGNVTNREALVNAVDIASTGAQPTPTCS